MKIKTIYELATSMNFDEFNQLLKSHLSGQPQTVVIPGEIIIDLQLIEPKKKLTPESFQLFEKTSSYFNKRFYNQNSWLDCYDKLIRIDKYTEEKILEIVFYFRREGNWWRDSGNFETLLKLRRLNPEKIKYIDVLSERIKSKDTRKQTGFPIGTIMQKEDGKQRAY